MIRVVLAVVVSAALFGLGLPAAERVDRERNAALATDELESVGDAAERLVTENDPIAPDRKPAATTVVVDVPEPTFANRGRVRIRDDELHWEPAGGRNHTVDPPVPIRVKTPIVAADRLRLRLSFVRIDGAAVVFARPVGPEV
ncbi:hypothetical protein KM295_00260 [Natronomonas sp. F2-12]|uniref:DUF7311 domain-containing protein n=1 Tax=Natronomonas aquatica TaxID=2841590 RepID=A0A9R1CQF5_9EURY|nr:hypothetical protein [Natronomonas aquatica]MCQ4331938.1 hypothetical protein [Natronomonas aquatica]